MQRNAKAALREIKRELAESQPGYSAQIVRSVDANGGISNVEAYLSGQVPAGLGGGARPARGGVGRGQGGQPGGPSPRARVSSAGSAAS